MNDEIFGFMNAEGESQPPPPPAPAYDAVVPKIVNGALVPQNYADPLAEAQRLMAPWKDRLPQLREYAAGLTVSSQDDLGIATKIVSRLKKLEKGANGARKALVDPLNQRVKAINAVFSEVVPEIKTAWQVIQGKMHTYTARIELERRKVQEQAEQATRELQAKLDAEAKAAGVEAPTVTAPVVPPAPKTIRTDEGTAYTIKRWVCRIVDEAKVPREYCAPVQSLLDAAVKGGVRTIDGCVIEEIEEMRTRS